MTKLNATITAVGGYVPEHILSNKDLETMVDTNDEWIVSRTGVKERRILKGEGLGSSFLAINAAKDLLGKKNIDSGNRNTRYASSLYGILYRI
jgi:3-oxoacyl-[acyl-carrier-protein] synthase-3